MLLKCGTDVNATTPEGQTALFPAACKGFVSVAELLVGSGRADVNRQDKDGWTALYSACFHGKHEVASVLLRAGANADCATTNGWTPLIAACAAGHPVVVELLIKSHAALDKQNADGRTALSYACEKGFRDIAETLLRSGAAVNLASKTGWTPLFIAAYNGRADLVELLLRCGADANKATSDGQTPICAVALNGRKDIAQTLAGAGAKFPANSLSNLLAKLGADTLAAFVALTGETLPGFNVSLVTTTVAASQCKGEQLFNAAESGNVDAVLRLSRDGAAQTLGWTHSTTLWTSLHAAAKNGNVTVVNALLTAGADVTKSSKTGETPLHIACQHGHVGVAEVLIRARSDVNKTDSSGNTPLHSVLAHNDDVLMVELLVLSGAMLNAENNNGCTPAFLAANNGHKNALMALVRLKADINRTTHRGWTPLFAAASSGNCEILQVLLHNGADPAAIDNDGYTSFYVAASFGHSDVAAMLAKAGSPMPERFLAQLEAKIGKELFDEVMGFAPKMLAPQGRAPSPTAGGRAAVPPLSSTASVAEVGEWLTALGLPDYVTRFAAEAIDGIALRHLTETSFPSLGVTKIGHQKRLLAAIKQVSAVLTEPHHHPHQPIASDATPVQQQQTTGGRFSASESESGLIYKGSLGLPPNYTPLGTCRECLATMRAGFVSKIPMFDSILNDCDQAILSVQTSPTARDLIEKHGLTRDEVYALVVYTYDIGMAGEPSENFYFQLNEILRRRNAAEMKQLLPYLYFAFGALRKLPSFQGVVYRGNNSPGIVQREYTTGREIFWSGFTSTTVDLTVAKQFAGSHGVVFRITINSGKIISAFSVLGGEREVLLPPNAGLFVARAIYTEADGTQYIDLVEKTGKFRW